MGVRQPIIWTCLLLMFLPLMAFSPLRLQWRLDSMVEKPTGLLAVSDLVETSSSTLSMSSSLSDQMKRCQTFVWRCLGLRPPPQPPLLLLAEGPVRAGGAGSLAELGPVETTSYLTHSILADTMTL